MSRTESEVVLIGELEYKIVTIGETKFSRYKPTDEWRCSTKPVADIQKAIDNAKSKAAGEAVDEPDKKTKCKAKKKKAKPSKLDDVVKAFAKGPKTMRQLNKATGHGPTAIKAVFKKLGRRITSKQIPRENAWSAMNTVTLWELLP